MFLFWRLLVGHLLADFPLQTDWIFSLKMQRRWGVVFHGLIAGILSLLVMIPYLRHGEMWFYLVIIGVFHVFIDKGKLVFTEKLGRQGENLFFLLVDQFFHIGFLWIICRFGVGERIEGLTIPIYGNSYIWKWLAGYIVTTYGATILIWSARSTLFSQEKPSLPPLPSKLLEFWERILVTTGFILGRFYYLLIPLGILPRSFLLFRGEKRISWIDLFLSFWVAIGVGVWLRSL